MAEKVAALEVAQGRLEERVSDLEKWQEKQNGSLQELEEKIDRIYNELNEKMNKIYYWLIGLLGGVVASLILLLININLGR